MQDGSVELCNTSIILYQIDKFICVFLFNLRIAKVFFISGDLLFELKLFFFVLCGKLLVITLGNITVDLLLE